MTRRFLTLAALLASTSILSACSDSQRLRDAAGILNPEVAARNNESTARERYDQSVADYRNCLADNPSNAGVCDGQRHIMEADEKVLSSALQRPSSTNVYVPSADEYRIRR
jgi:hypothetical protein